MRICPKHLSKLVQLCKNFVQMSHHKNLLQTQSKFCPNITLACPVVVNEMPKPYLLANKVRFSQNSIRAISKKNKRTSFINGSFFSATSSDLYATQERLFALRSPIKVTVNLPI